MARQRCRKLSDGEKIRKLNAAAIFFCTTIRTLVRHEIRYEFVPAIRIPPPYISECNVRACTRARISSARTAINCTPAIIVIRACLHRSIAYLSRADCENDRDLPRKVVNCDFQRRALFVKGEKNDARSAYRKKKYIYICTCNSHL